MRLLGDFSSSLASRDWSEEDFSLTFPSGWTCNGAGAPEGLGGGTFPGPFQVGGRPLVSTLDSRVGPTSGP